MPRLDQLTEYLFLRPGVALTLDSETPGFYVDEQGAATPVFKQTLRTRELLRLLAPTVPRGRQDDFRSGKPIDFVFETPRGGLSVHLALEGETLRARLALAAGGEELLRSGPSLLAQGGIAPPMPSVEPPRRKTSLALIISRMTAKGASHLHLAENQGAFARIEGQLVCLAELGQVSRPELLEAVLALAPQSVRERLDREPHFEFSHVSTTGVFHVRGQQGREGLGVVVRALPRQVPAATSLGLPDEFACALRGAGLWVVAGGAGQGTSTTVAALVQGALAKRPLEVCTLESPLDYVLDPKKGLVQQLEIGVHAPSFAAALEDARRGDADLVVVGQLDDAQTLAAALALADRGRLVLGVVHSRSAVAAAQKLINLSPGTTGTLASMLRGVFAQSLVPNTKGHRSLCWELLPGSDAVKDLVREGDSSQLGPLLIRSSDQSLLQLVQRREVEVEIALTYARDRLWFETQLARPRAA